MLDLQIQLLVQLGRELCGVVRLHEEADVFELPIDQPVQCIDLGERLSGCFRPEGGEVVTLFGHQLVEIFAGLEVRLSTAHELRERLEGRQPKLMVLLKNIRLFNKGRGHVKHDQVLLIPPIDFDPPERVG